MSYQVIARKYRPQRFADVVGQEHVTTTLSNAIASGRIAHAYLFCGPRGTGKTTLARIFAKCLNCTGGPSVNFTDDDPRAREITEGRSLDVLEIDGASNNGVEQVRELRDTVKFAPASSKFKIYIIDEVHMLTVAAFNALLKTLEEPPAHVKFLFATTDPERVLPTILSRCQRFDLRRIPAALITAQLGRIAVTEGVQIDEAALYAIARGADGGMRDAQSTLDQLISFCGNTIVETDVLSMFGLAAREQLRELAGALLTGDAAAALRLFDGFARTGKDLGRLLGDLLSHFRNLLLFQISRGDRSLIEVGDEEFALLGEQSKLADVDALTRILEVLSAADGRLRDSASKRIFIEVTLLKAIQAREAVNLDTVLRQLRNLREGLPTPGPTAGPAAAPSPTLAPAPAVAPIPAVAPTPTVAPVVHAAPTIRPAPVPTAPTPPTPSPVAVAAKSAPTPAPALPATPALVPAPISTPPPAPAVVGTSPPSGVTDTAAAPVIKPTPVTTAEEAWVALGGALTQADTMLRTSLERCRAVNLVRGTLTLSHPEDVLIDTTRNIATLKARLKAATGQDFDLRFETDLSAAPAPVISAPTAVPRPTPRPAETRPGESRPNETGKPLAAAPVPFNKEEFLNDPLIKDALEIFKGRIIEVRPEA